MRNIILLTTGLLMMFSCVNNNSNTPNKSDNLSEEQILNNYLKDNNIQIEPLMSGLYFIEIEEGEGTYPTPSKTVKVHYTGYFLNGDVFDSSYNRNKPFEFKLGAGQVIRGWDEGVARMKIGGKYKLIIPSYLAYGDSDRGPIPANSTLIFDIELIEAEE